MRCICSIYLLNICAVYYVVIYEGNMRKIYMIWWYDIENLVTEEAHINWLKTWNIFVSTAWEKSELGIIIIKIIIIITIIIVIIIS